MLTKTDSGSYLDDIGYILWSFGLEDDPYGARNENHDQGYHNATIGHLVLEVPLVDAPAVDIQEEWHHPQSEEGGTGGHHNAGERGHGRRERESASYYRLLGAC